MLIKLIVIFPIKIFDFCVCGRPDYFKHIVMQGMVVDPIVRKFYNVRHVKSIKIKTILRVIFVPPASIPNWSTMENIPPTREKGKHLSDVDIEKILGLAKAAMPQRKIAALMKCCQNTVQNILATYVFETFQRCNPR